MYNLEEYNKEVFVILITPFYICENLKLCQRYLSYLDFVFCFIQMTMNLFMCMSLKMDMKRSIIYNL